MSQFTRGHRDRGDRPVLLDRVLGGKFDTAGRLDAKHPAAPALAVVHLARREREGQPLAIARHLDHALAAALAQRLQQRRDVVETLHRAPVDGGDTVALGQGAPGRAVGKHPADVGGNGEMARHQADAAEDVALVEVLGQLRQAQAQVALAALFVGHAQRHVAAVERGRQQRHLQFHPGRRLAVAELQYAVVAAQARGLGDAARRAEHGRVVRAADHEHRPQQGEAQQQVRTGTGGDDRHALPHRLAVEGLRGLALGHVDLALVEHLDVAAQRDRRDAVLGAIARRALPQRAAEPDGEAQHAHAAAARDPEVPEFVDGHEDAKADQQPPGGAEEVSHGGGSSEGPCGDGVAGVASRAGIGLAERGQRLCRFGRDSGECVLHQAGDRQETDPPLKKR